MNLHLPITLQDEMADDVIEARAMLDLASGEITQVQYLDHDLESEGFPGERQDYDFTCGVLANGDREVEFRVEVDVVGRSYSITPSELLELKGRAAKLFAAPPGTHVGPDVPAVAAGRGPKPTAKVPRKLGR